MQPPKLNGYSYVRALGEGTTAAVFLYEQHGTERQVAIKVSRGRLDPRAGARFRTEANFMAKLSTHPYILSIYETGVTDDGRSFIVFEYATRGNMKDLLDHGTYGVDETLDIGINLASALYTAHRAGIVHRDIKTSNVLISDQGLPALADFGIATNIYDHRATGYSLPWAPPEVLRSQGGGDEKSDMYSLAATLYAMLAGKSPYEYGYHPHTQQELASAIMNRPLPALNRADVPEEVEHVLARALSKNREDRYYSVLEFAYALQEAQQHAFGHATPVTVEGVERFSRALTRQQAAATAAATGALGAGMPGAAGASAAVNGASGAQMRRGIVIASSIVAAFALIALVVVLVVLPNIDRGQSSSVAVVNPNATASQSTNADTGDYAGSAVVPGPEALSGSIRGDSAVFSWSNPDPQTGDKYSWNLLDGANSSEAATITTDTHVSVPASPGAQTCIQVSIIRADRSMSQAVPVCATR
ncbi:kinase domain protein [Bifidobacterium gallicum DSM 20093 = LMG 11596]|uniref:non-specific serine/threonine protein kinase n=1 Tax=Bifidobacterium gallicum DSM 20093 = LMG 11596 TaxID=561180 RepID=D1NTB3_9BIFI|nr:kinase domain protein [Bifidobacterium gallicum DSM 20093 = LMG 11596]